MMSEALSISKKDGMILLGEKFKEFSLVIRAASAVEEWRLHQKHVRIQQIPGILKDAD